MSALVKWLTVTNWYRHPLTVPTDETVDLANQKATVERWFTTIGEAWDATWDRELQPFVVKDSAKGETVAITRLFRVMPSTLETPAGDAWLSYAPMDANGVGGMPILAPLLRIDSIGLVDKRLTLAIETRLLDEHIGECVMLQVREDAPHSIPPWTFHGVLRRVDGIIAYEMDPPDHDYPLAVPGNDRLRFEYIAIARATLCPVTHGRET
ncbi:MAG TPA: hypothetical protein VGU66_09005 [Candidatus Elarobacter sp.]|nr:hypothetical protein [Candidatus Elarobacter sp.]